VINKKRRKSISNERHYFEHFDKNPLFLYLKMISVNQPTKQPPCLFIAFMLIQN